MKYLLDTDTVSFLLKNHPAVVRNSALHPTDSWAISAVSACELESVRGPRIPNHSWKARIDDFLKAIPVVPFGIEEARKAGEITRYLTEQGLPSGPYDILIAAQALVSGSTLVTHNSRHFENIPLLKLADWVEK